MQNTRFIAYLLVATSLFFAHSGCSKRQESIRIDGSSTVLPITQAIMSEYAKDHADVNISASKSGTGGGMKKFSSGELEITGASRPIKNIEKENCEKNGVAYVTFTVAYDGLAVVVNSENTWCKCLTTDQLKELWRPHSAIKKWSDIDPSWPEKEIKLYGPGTDSGTFDYFTKKIIGEEGASRKDYQASENDVTLVRGIAGDKFALGYFGYAYYAENKESLNLVGVDSGSGCVVPTESTVRDNSYKPLSRPLFIYVQKKALKNPKVKKFVEFYISNASRIVGAVGYVSITEDLEKKNQNDLKNALKK